MSRHWARPNVPCYIIPLYATQCVWVRCLWWLCKLEWNNTLVDIDEKEFKQLSNNERYVEQQQHTAQRIKKKNLPFKKLESNKENVQEIKNQIIPKTVVSFLSLDFYPVNFCYMTRKKRKFLFFLFLRKPQNLTLEIINLYLHTHTCEEGGCAWEEGVAHPNIKKRNFVESDKRFGTINPLHHQTCRRENETQLN